MGKRNWFWVSMYLSRCRRAAVELEDILCDMDAFGYTSQEKAPINEALQAIGRARQELERMRVREDET